MEAEAAFGQGSGAMKVFIQSCRTKKFYAGDGRWAPMRNHALECGTSIRAEQIAVQDGLKSVSLVLTFETGRNTVVVPLSTFATVTVKVPALWAER
jgi:hypothetical protein